MWKSITIAITRANKIQMNEAKTTKQTQKNGCCNCIIMPLEELAARAQKVIDLNKQFDETFNSNYYEHLKMAIMAGIKDAFVEGYQKGKVI